MLFPLGTWSSICISHNEVLKLHRDTSNEPGTLNYTVTLGDFQGGGLLLESPTGSKSLYVDALQTQLLFSVVNTKAAPLAFDGNLWHGTEPFIGDRWVITAYTCKHLASFKKEDVSALLSWGFPLPGADATSATRSTPSQPIPSPPLPSKFCLVICSLRAREIQAGFSTFGVPHVCVECLEHDSIRRQVFRGAAEGVFPTVFIVYSTDWSMVHTSWVLKLCKVAFSSGSILHFDISDWSTCWSDQLFLHCVATGLNHVVQIPTCAFKGTNGRPWIFVSSSEAFATGLGAACSCNRCHDTLCAPFYPPALIEVFSSMICAGALDKCQSQCSFSVSEAWSCIPVKTLDASPHSWVDGGGLHSRPDWSGKQKKPEDRMHSLRHSLMSFCASFRIPSRLRHRLSHPSEEHLFTDSELLELRRLFSDWFRTQNVHSVDWSIPSGQPYCLHSLAALSSVLQDCDVSLFGALLSGVPTGYNHDIPLSGCFAPSGREPSTDSLSICMENWSGAESDPLLLEQLVQVEVDSGWLRHVESLEAAQSIWPNVAIGKLNIVHSEGRKPRLVVDSSICGTNACCMIPEKCSLPTLQTIQAGFPLRNKHESLAAWSLDVRSAHKSIRVRSSEQGLLGIRVGPKLYFYTVCPFGATFSAFWFARLGAFFVRALHLLIYIAHFLALYVDDLLGFQSASVAEMSFCITLCFCGAFSIPLSWKKLQFGCCIRWIGWELDFGMGCVSIPEDKLVRLHTVISSALKGKYTDRTTLSKLCGMLQWLFKLFPLAKPWLRALYLDLNTPRATNFSVRQHEWQTFVSCLNDTLHLTRVPSGAAITLGSKILAVRHRKVKTKRELLHCNLGDKDIWVRVADPASKRRSLSLSSKALLHFWLNWSQLPPLWCALRPQQHLSIEAAADAMGNGEVFAIGGYISLPAGDFWFSEKFTVSDFAFADLPLKSEAHRDISCYECLGQIALVWLLSVLHPCCRLSVRMHSWCDNTGAESAANKLFTTAWPLAAFTQRLALLSSFTGIHLDVQHIAGPKNEDADYLSRWLEHTPLATRWKLSFRRRISLRQLWHASPQISISPPPWEPRFPVPSGSPLGAAL